EHWHGMPEFVQADQMPASKINVQFRSERDRRNFLAVLGEDPAQRKSVWYPRMPWLYPSVKNAAPVAVEGNRYPVYVISKGRWDQRLTCNALEKLGIPYHLVVESQEYECYAEVVDPGKILRLPFGNLGKGSIPARNWVWRHAEESGAERHWILD